MTNIFKFPSSSDESEECDNETASDITKNVQKHTDGNFLFFVIVCILDFLGRFITVKINLKVYVSPLSDLMIVYFIISIV